MIRQQLPAIFFTAIKPSSLNKKLSSLAHTQTSINSWFYFLLIILVLYITQVSDSRAEVYLPVIGGSGGGQFIAPCPQGQNLTGFELRIYDDVDAIRPLCVYAYGPNKISAPQMTKGTGVVVVVEDMIPVFKVEPGWYGGPGGQISSLRCPAKTPIVLGIYVGAEGAETIIVNNIHLYCGLAVNDQQQEVYPSAIFDAPGYKPTPALLGIGSGGKRAEQLQGQERCPAGQVAVGMHGRSGKWLDAMGLICDVPTIITPKSLGRVKVPPTTSTTPQSICDSARSARARNSPAAPTLEAQCKASGEIHYKSLGRVKTSPTTNLPPKTICESAQSARARNSPAAPALEAQCKAQEAQEAQTKVLETEPVEVQNPALQVVAPKATNAEDTKLDPNNPELEWPMQ
jgi:hypothetical protein